jgi:RNA polymerase sigma-70 factor (ECF subfamily)
LAVPPTDEQLMERLQQGQTGALDELYRRYAPKLYTFCRYTARTLDAQSVEDLVQDVFMRVIKSAHTYDARRASFRTWLFRIARNRCIDVMRRAQRVRMLPILDRAEQGDEAGESVQESALVDERQDTEGDVAWASVLDALRECIEALADESERQALLLYYLGGKVYREIGQVLGKSTSTAKNRVQSAQRQLKRCLEEKGIHGAP